MSSVRAKSSSLSSSPGRSTWGTTSSRIGLPVSSGGRQRTRAIAGSASLARRSKSSIVTARPPARSECGPRRLALSTVSASTPPIAAEMFSTRSTYGSDVRMSVNVAGPTLPAAPPP